jgi:hypothetical protein
VYYFFLFIYSPYLVARAALNIGLIIYKTFFPEILYSDLRVGALPALIFGLIIVLLYNLSSLFIRVKYKLSRYILISDLLQLVFYNGVF